VWTGRVESRRSTDRSHSADCGAAIVVTAAASTPVDHCSGREGFKEQLQGNEKDSPLLLDVNVGPIESAASQVPAKSVQNQSELGLNENSRENDDNCG